jgi:hypothetical protein
LYQLDVAINTNIGLLVDLAKRTEKGTGRKGDRTDRKGQTEKGDRKGDIQDFAFPNHAGYLTNHKS